MNEIIERDRTEYHFVVDTDKYAGNFERQLLAYISGRIGECEVGDDEAKIYYEEMGYKNDGYWTGVSVAYFYENCESPFDYIISKADDNGCRRPATIYPSADSSENKSVACVMERRPTTEELEILKSRALKFVENYWPETYFGRSKKIEILGFRLITQEVKVNRIEENV